MINLSFIINFYFKFTHEQNVDLYLVLQLYGVSLISFTTINTEYRREVFFLGLNSRIKCEKVFSMKVHIEAYLRPPKQNVVTKCQGCLW